MRRFFYGISIFLFLCILSLGYYGTYQAALRRGTEHSETASREEQGYGLYYLTEKDGVVAVYESDKKTLFETTGIVVSDLPKQLRQEIRAGKYLKTQGELYGFLENYSS